MKLIIGGSIIFIVLLFAGPLLWFGAMLALPPVEHYFAVQSYSQGNCKILAKQILNYSSYDQNSGSTSTQYAPDFKFTVRDVADKNYSAQGYGTDQHLFMEEGGAQALLDHYQIDHTYACWYDQTHPSQAVLTRDVTEWILLLPGGIMLVVGLGILIGAGISIKKLKLLTRFT